MAIFTLAVRSGSGQGPPSRPPGPVRRAPNLNDQPQNMQQTGMKQGNMPHGMVRPRSLRLTVFWCPTRVLASRWPFLKAHGLVAGMKQGNMPHGMVRPRSLRLTVFWCPNTALSSRWSFHEAHGLVAGMKPGNMPHGMVRPRSLRLTVFWCPNTVLTSRGGYSMKHMT